MSVESGTKRNSPWKRVSPDSVAATVANCGKNGLGEISSYYILRFWREAEEGYLTPRQREWCEIWETLGSPSAAAVAKQMEISKQAAAKMGRRIISRLFLKLLPDVEKIAAARKLDKKLEEIAAAKQERIEARPEYLERSERRGRVRWLHFQAGGGFDERLGRETVSGYFMREVSETEAAELEARGVPLVRRRWKIHKESPLMRWWIQKARELQKARGIRFTEALQELYRVYAAKRPPGAQGAARCRRCGSPLPYGETIPGSGMGRITARREFCSNFCKTTHKRTR